MGLAADSANMTLEDVINDKILATLDCFSKLVCNDKNARESSLKTICEEMMKTMVFLRTDKRVRIASIQLLKSIVSTQKSSIKEENSQKVVQFWKELFEEGLLTHLKTMYAMEQPEIQKAINEFFESI